MKDSKGIQDFQVKLNKLHVISRRLVEEVLGGTYRSVFRGPGIEFSDVREYNDRDDIRFIDWNVTARLGTPFSRTYREERELVLCFIVDVSASLFYGKTIQKRLELQQLLVAILSFCALRNNDKVGALFFSDRIEKWITPRKGNKHAYRLIKDLILWEPKGKGSDLALALKTVAGQLKKRAIVFIFSDFKMGGYAKELSLLAKKHDVIGVRIYDNLDEKYPAVGYVRLKDPETNDYLPSLGLSKRFQKEYEEYRAFWRRVWMRELNRNGADVLEIATHQDPGVRLIQFFERRRKHR